jgi:undecaprenyl-diphosphatase
MLDIIASHSHIAYFLIFLISLLESLAIVGLVFPGTLIMLGVGVVVSTGTLSLKPVIIAAIIGSIMGDGLSYWLGRIYHQSLKGLWPFSRHPGILPRGELFFHKHGGKSVLFGRFIGPMRPVIPIVAGMLGMPPLRFTLVNVASGIAWAFAYTLPGVFFGTSVALAGNISSRLSILIIIIVAVVWLFVWICHHLINFMIRYGPQWFSSLETWIVDDTPGRGASSFIKRLLSWLLLREKGEEFLLVFLALILFLTGLGFLSVLKDVVIKDQMVQADQAIYHFLQSLRNPWGDYIFVAVTELGDGLVYVSLVIAVFLTLFFSRCYRTARYWLFSIIGGACLYLLIKWGLHIPRPLDLTQSLSSYSFPSGHTTMSVILYGTLAVLVAKGLRNTVKWGLFAAVFFISFVIAFSRLYLGVHWLSDILGGFLLASFWTALTGIIYLKGHSEVIPKRLLAFVTLVVLITVGSFHVNDRHRKDLSLYAPRHETVIMDIQTWLKGGWKKLPAWRIDLRGEKEQPLTVQWVGSLETLAQDLVSQGWKTPPEPDLKAFLGMLSPETKVRDIPLFPHLHNGRFESMVLLQDVGNERLVLRIWPSDVRLKNTRASSFWVGTVEIQREYRLANLITITKDKSDYNRPLETLVHPLKDKGWLRGTFYRKAGHIHGDDPSDKVIWNSQVVLAMEPPS